jgi:hypothetical protein
VWVGVDKKERKGESVCRGKKNRNGDRETRKFGRDLLARERNVEIRPVSREERAGFDSHRDSVGWD